MPLLISTASGRIDESRDHALFGKERHVPAQQAPVSGGYPMRAIRTDDYLYIRNFMPDRWPVGTPDHVNAYFENAWLADTDNGPTKTYIWQHRSEPGGRARSTVNEEPPPWGEAVAIRITWPSR